MAEHLQVKFNFRKRKGVTEVSDVGVKPKSAAAKSRKKKKDNDLEGYADYLEQDAMRKKETYASTSDGMTHAEKEERRQKWKEAKKAQRKKNRGNTLKRSKDNHVKIKDMTVAQKRSYNANKKKENRNKLSSQKKTVVTERETKRRRLTRGEEHQAHQLNKCTPSKPVKIKSPPSRTHHPLLSDQDCPSVEKIYAVDDLA